MYSAGTSGLKISRYQVRWRLVVVHSATYAVHETKRTENEIEAPRRTPCFVRVLENFADGRDISARKKNYTFGVAGW